MGKKQCDACGHIVTGFEDDEWHMRGHAVMTLIRRKDAEIEELRAEVARLRGRKS